MTILIHLLQTIVALGIFDVWVLRASLPTAFRGGASKSLREEFVVYGLPGWVFYAVGTLKLLSAALLIAGLWLPALAAWASLLMAFLMVGALTMHLKIKDPLTRSVPALTILALSLCIAAFYFLG